MVRETSLAPSQLVLPLFVRSGRGVRQPVESMTGVCQTSVDELVKDAKAAAARDAGCVEVINYAKEDFVERVRALTNGNGVAAAFDSVGGDTLHKSLQTLKPRGVLVAFGKASGDPPALDPFLLAPRSLYVTWPIRPNYIANRQELETSAADLFDAIRSGILKVGPNRTYAFDDIVSAHRDLETRKIVGAAILKI